MDTRIIEDFKQDVEDFATIDIMIKQLTDQIEPLKKRLKELKETKKEIQKDICSFMGQNELQVCNLSNKPGGIEAIRYTHTNARVPLTHLYIKELLIDFFVTENQQLFNSLKNSDKGEFLYKHIQESRSFKPREGLRKIKHLEADIVKVLSYETNDEYDFVVQ